MIPRPAAYRCGAARGLRYGTLPAEIEEALPRWIETRTVPEGVELKPRVLYRVKDWAVKLVPAPSGWRSFRRSPALRAAEIARSIQPLRAPRPLVALQGRRGLRVGDGLLVAEFVEGPHLGDAWDDPAAMAAFPAFLAQCHRRGVFHGDLHPRNLLWNGVEWVLLDLESLRHGLHGVFSRRLIEGQWSRIYRNMSEYREVLEPRAHEIFERYLTAAGLDWNAKRTWSRIVAQAERKAEVKRARRGL